MDRQKYYCVECEVSLSATREEALAEIAEGHTLFQDATAMPIADAKADAETLRWWAQDNPQTLAALDLRNACSDSRLFPRSAAHAAFYAVPGLRG